MSASAAERARSATGPAGARAAAPALAVSGLSAWYGSARILFDVDLSVGRGEVVALMGRNGAGKSTTLRSIMGLVARRSGSVRFDGREVSRLPAYRIARLGVGYVPEDRRIFTDLTVLENLDVGAKAPRAWSDGAAPRAWTPERLFRLFPNLGRMPDRRGGMMSGGEQQMLSVARTLMGNPLVVLLDEPSEGVAPVIVEELAATILEMKAAGLSVLLSEQNLAFAEAVADRVHVLDQGAIRFSGTFAELAADGEVRARHLGL